MTPRFLTDENVDSDLLVGLRRRVEGIDLIRVQDVGLRTKDDPTILDWAAGAGRALISRDIKTVPVFASARVAAGLPMAGVFVLPPALPLGAAMEDLALIAEVTDAGEWSNRVVYLPLR